MEIKIDLGAVPMAAWTGSGRGYDHSFAAGAVRRGRIGPPTGTRNAAACTGFPADGGTHRVVDVRRDQTPARGPLGPERRPGDCLVLSRAVNLDNGHAVPP